MCGDEYGGLTQATAALNNEEETSAKREQILRKLVSGNAGKTKRAKVQLFVSELV